MSTMGPKSVLFQLGAVMNPGLALTDIRPLSTGACGASEYIGEVVPKAPAHSAALPVVARKETSLYAQALEVNWEEVMDNPENFEEVLGVMREAGRIGDEYAVRVLCKVENQCYEVLYEGKDHRFISSYNEALRAIGTKAVPALIKILREDDCDSGILAVSYIRNSTEMGVDCRQTVPALLASLEDYDNQDTAWNFIPETLACIGDRCAVEGLKKIAMKNRNAIFDYQEQFLEDDLKRHGMSARDIEEILNPPRADDFDDPPLHRAMYDFLTTTREAKRVIFENTAVLNVLPDRQAWITINDPQLARDAVGLVLKKVGSKGTKFDNILAATLNVRIKDLEESHYLYYADELLDAVVQFVKRSPLERDGEMQALLAKVRFGDDVKLRYVRREKADLSLGDKCGDCTSKGSIHFNDSLTWLVNPAYQILKMSKGGRFIGKIHFTLGALAGEEAIIIDAIEFNPQAQEGQPYYEDGLACFTAAMGFLKGLAARQARSLFALRTSNSSGAVEILDGWGKMIGKDKALQLLAPSDDVQRLLTQVGYKGKITLFYQMLEGGDAPEEDSKDLTDDKLQILENEVVNPAQRSSEEVATAMRVRDFETAAKFILASREWHDRIRRIFGVPQNMNIGSTFIVKKLEKMYAAQAVEIESLEKSTLIKAGSFVKIRLE